VTRGAVAPDLRPTDPSGGRARPTTIRLAASCSDPIGRPRPPIRLAAPRPFRDGAATTGGDPTGRPGPDPIGRPSGRSGWLPPPGSVSPPRDTSAPHDPGAGLGEHEVKTILDYKKKHPSMGPAQIRAHELKRFFGWRVSVKAIARVLRKAGYAPVHRRGRPVGDEHPRRVRPRKGRRDRTRRGPADADHQASLRGCEINDLVKLQATGPRTRPAALERWRQSGDTIAAFARAHGVSAPRLYWFSLSGPPTGEISTLTGFRSLVTIRRAGWDRV
jgi:hypothetical protein